MTRYAAILAILAASALAPAHAAIVTFDDAAGQAQTGVYQAGESFSDQGLTFTYSPTGSAYMFLSDGMSYPTNGTNGTDALLVGSMRSDYVTITRTGGGVFSISSLLLGINEAANPAETTDSVLINGTPQSVTNTATNDAVSAYNVTSVTISGLVAGGYVAVDNITYQVPEPVSLSVLGVGLAAAALTRRRRGAASPA